VDILTVTLNTAIDRTLEVPGFAVGGHVRGRLIRVQPAGKGVNVSRSLAALGVPSRATGFVGQREILFFEETFARSPVSPTFVSIPSPTRTNTTILDPEAGTDTHIRELGPTIEPAALEVLRTRLRELVGPGTLAVFCGSLPPGVGCGELAALVQLCRAHGAELLADLNGPHLAAAVEAGARIVKPNVAELGELLDRQLAPESEPDLLDAASTLLGKVQTVLVTRGALGALAVSTKQTLACRVEIEKPRNTVGCGDAFLAGYLAGLWRNQDLADRLRLATACGAAAALAEAAGMLDPAEVERLASRARTWEPPRS